MSPEFTRLLAQGVFLVDQGRHEEALGYFERLLSFEPFNVDALNNCGSMQILLGRYQDAILKFDLVVRLKPQFAPGYNNRGLANARLNRPVDALADFDTALRIAPDYPDALKNRGELLARMGAHEELIANCDRILQLVPANAATRLLRAQALSNVNRNDDALEDVLAVLGLRPDDREALTLQTKLLQSLGRVPEALTLFDRLVALAPDDANVLNNRGIALGWLGRFEDALADYDRAIALKPNFAEALLNRGTALLRLRRIEDDIENSDRILKLWPMFPAAHVHDGISRLLQGDLRTGLRQYEWRWYDSKQGLVPRGFAQALWMGGESLQGKSILLHTEQGFGDAIQFLRYAPLVAKKGAKVFLEIPKRLAPLVSGLAGVEAVIPSGSSLPATDFYCPLLSLPLAFDTTLESIPAPVPYLTVDVNASGAWRAKLGQGSEKLVGVCWKGSAEYHGDHERSIRFADFAPLLTVPGVRFVSLQKDLTEEEQRLAKKLPMLHPGEDFKSTAEMIACLDLVISVDTAWAHWAGAIGRPFWILLPCVPHWVWLLDREDSPWYPTARLFRQQKWGDWKSVIQKVKRELSKSFGTA